MNLVIDSGATKANWTLADGNAISLQVQTQGLHPLLMPDETLRALAQEAHQRGIKAPRHIFYYGTGCKVESSRQRLQSVLRQVFPDATSVAVETDLLGAARALCQRAAGIACILGTGSNSCYYDGKQIVDNKGGYGFILGDEGSGADLGKQLMSDFLNAQIPPDLHQKLVAQYGLTPADVIEATYRRPAPSRFLATFAPFLLENMEAHYIKALVNVRIMAFLTKYVLAYRAAAQTPVHFTGSIAWYFRAQVEAALQKLQLQPGSFLPDPMEGLVRFHQ